MFQIHAAAAEEDRRQKQQTEQNRAEQQEAEQRSFSSSSSSRGVPVPATEELQFQARRSLTTWLLGYLADLVTAEVIVNAWS